MSKNRQLMPPLAERVRPAYLQDFLGQDDLTGEGTLLQQSIASGKLFSCVLWGPPGTGKTTLAKILAKSLEGDFFQISAVSSGVKDLRKIIETAKTNLTLNTPTVLFIDEIHRFNKAQQDALLHSVEDGTLTLIGATTENPSFEVISPLLSRCRVLKLKSLEKNVLKSILLNAINIDVVLMKHNISFKDGTQEKLVLASGGDARKMLNTLEAAVTMSNQDGKTVVVDKKLLSEALQSKSQIYDKAGDYHYDTISAFIKSVRGSDPDAAVYWLAIMLEGGEMPEFVARRLIILASEDIGNADPQALGIATSGFQAVHVIGMPEAALILAQVTIYLASAPKSNASYVAVTQAINKVKEEGTSSVPLHLRNAPTPLMKSFDYGKDYTYPHNHPDHFTDVNYFPEEMAQTPFYKPTNQGYEEFISKRLKDLWPERRS
ncbi:MAG TPA: replication-associated recombination protein A [Candidatus Marinimicrobia bacterium]|nr:replication-associated recombination protein A [Candidatus Neomarinimicrobiota bacterium]HIB02272.1 replication-associated recombination protein A [Candidatus Neomarinimicrobiota bacterium]HIB71772.1 replication-associated recombination protein A [Candidatus Neomarinimicrobiota bacterium]HIB95269.1 replication-associated recombination protein A [Candidatus Neomarinimicrobiota bacterium]HIN62627.1 replication-associated recombination protein A [Candidatus Neomarinimicrobiota bacterium]